MPSVEEVIGTITEEFPELVVSLSGPWHETNKPGQESTPPAWICNFKQRDLFLEYIHPGSSAPTPSEALEAGLAFAREWRAGRNARAM